MALWLSGPTLAPHHHDHDSPAEVERRRVRLVRWDSRTKLKNHTYTQHTKTCKCIIYITKHYDQSDYTDSSGSVNSSYNMAHVHFCRPTSESGSYSPVSMAPKYVGQSLFFIMKVMHLMVRAMASPKLKEKSYQ